MARTKENGYPHRHEKHIARNGQSEARYGVKKMGAGPGNWGVLGDEVPDVQALARSEIESFVGTSTKVNIVDSKTFENMRNHTEQES